MFPYIIVAFISCVSLFFAVYLKDNKSSGYHFFIAVALFPLVMLAAYRGQWVGTDTYTYLELWNNVEFRSFENKSILFSEPAFHLLEVITRYISKNTFFGHEVFLGSISILVCSLCLSSILKHANFKSFSWLLFILLGVYTFHFNGARQAIAIALFMFSLRFIINRNFILFILVVLLGFFFHKSMLVCLPFYFLYGKKLDYKQVLLIVVLSVLVAISITSIVEVASEYDARYKSYADGNSSGGGLVTVLFNSALLVWLWMSKRFCSIEDRIYDLSLLMMLIAVCIGWMSVILSLNPSGILRLSMYFTQFVIFSLPLSVMYYKRGGTRAFVLTSVLLVLFVYFYLTTTSFSGLAPYRLGVELYF
ncbi:hypothetical protein CXF86_05410 [Shewanella sp. GutCb]|uniref:EpsG family protein n=1 Tax=Shewanella sp. GutCb TaxID=2058315 RepID=UPI000C7B299F|nr:EpsG family protein [Shewanella sp. GutCb]PKG75763.1 hypothetical protein CXF86_05410 [Shewanella sp. GutCb]